MTAGPRGKRGHEEVSPAEDELLGACSALLEQCADAIDTATERCRPRDNKRRRDTNWASAADADAAAVAEGELPPLGGQAGWAASPAPSWSRRPAASAESSEWSGWGGTAAAAGGAAIHEGGVDGMDGMDEDVVVLGDDGAAPLHWEGDGDGMAAEATPEAHGSSAWVGSPVNPPWGRSSDRFADMMEEDGVVDTNPLALATPRKLELSSTLVEMLRKLGLQWYAQADGSLLANGGLEVSDAALAKLRAKVDKDGVIRIHSTNDSGDSMLVEGRLSESSPRPFGRSACRVDIRIKLLPQWPRPINHLTGPPVLLGLPAPRPARSPARTCYITEAVDGDEAAGWAQPKRKTRDFEAEDEDEEWDGPYEPAPRQPTKRTRTPERRGLAQAQPLGHRSPSRFRAFGDANGGRGGGGGMEAAAADRHDDVFGRFRRGGSDGGPTEREDGFGGKRRRMVVDDD